MLRYAVLGMTCLVGGSALAQQAAPLTETTTQQSIPAPKAVVAMEEPQPGDHWTYQVKDEITGKVGNTLEHVVTEVTPNNISMRVKAVDSPDEGFNVYDRSWNLLSNARWRYSPHQGSTGISAPLEVGKSWTFQSNNTNSNNGAIWKETGTSRVVGQEAVTTKAGTFDSFKIETSFSIRNAKDVTRKNEIVFQTWYAPAIDHWVKRITLAKVDKHVSANRTFELIDYGRKQ